MPEPSDALGELLAGQLRAEQRDRRRLADRLHDGPQQVLVSLGIRLQLLQQQLPEDLVAEAEVLLGQVEAARHALRGLVVDLEAPASDTSLEDGLRWLLETNAAAAGWRTALDVALDATVDDAVRLTVQRAVQETLADTRLHADAGHVEVTVAHVDGWLEVTVADDGADRTEPARAGRRDTGTAAALDRAAALGGTAHVHRDGAGTRVRVRVPMRLT